MENMIIKGKDTFKVLRIMKKMGVAELVKENKKEALSIVKQFSDKDGKDKEKAVKEAQELMGTSILADIIIDKIELAETEIFDFLASITNISLEDLYEKEINELAELIVSIVKENIDFFTKASSLTK